jgi:hypothetical protein
MSEASMDRARVQAQLEERSRAASELHVGALETLKEVRSRWHEHDRVPLRNRARREALRLRKALASGDRTDVASSLVGHLERLAEDYATLGINTELVTAEDEHEPEPRTTQVLIDATRQVLEHLVSEGALVRLVIRAATSQTSALLTIRDSDGNLYGIAEQLGQLEALLAGAGGCARVQGKSRLILEVLA